ncbi:MAG: hypothetical protein ABGZ35_17635 [Planctomycetaceae bacterium]
MNAVRVAGPNTVGEAGKVYFAHRFQTGQSLFATADQPPYYPSFHGPLFHSVVGAIGRVCGATVLDLYGIGRTISVLATCGSFLLAGLILRQLGTGWKWLTVLIVVAMGMEATFQHTISFRPDNWILFLTALTCFLMMTCREQTWAIVAVTLISVVAFFIKPTGISIAGCVVGVLLMERRWKAAILSAAGSVVITSILTVGLNAVSEGAYFQAMNQARGVPFRMSSLLGCLNFPVTWASLAVPFVLVSPVLRSPLSIMRSRQLILIVFWAVSLAFACVTATRMGSGPYYMNSAVLFGLILICHWLSIESKQRRWHSGIVGLVVLAGLPSIPPAVIAIDHAVFKAMPLHDISVHVTKHFEDERSIVSAMGNVLSQPVFSDDPGLNVLLNRPAVLEPILVAMMIANGSFDESILLEAVRQQRYGMIVLTGSEGYWQFEGVAAVSDAFMQEVIRHYRQIRSDLKYTVMIPADEQSPPDP